MKHINRNLFIEPATWVIYGHLVIMFACLFAFFVSGLSLLKFPDNDINWVWAVVGAVALALGLASACEIDKIERRLSR